MTEIDQKKMKEAIDAISASLASKESKDAVIKFAEAIGYKPEPPKKRYELMLNHEPVPAFMQKFINEVQLKDNCILQVRSGGEYKGRGFYMGINDDWVIINDNCSNRVLTHKSIVEEVRNGQ